MKEETGLGHVQTILLIVIIAVLVATGIYFVRVKYNESYIETIKTNMLTIRWKAESYVNSKRAAKEEITYFGTKASELKDIDSYVKLLFDKGILNDENADKYYVLSDGNMEQLKLEITNEKESYYLINYETYDVIITKGCSYDSKNVYYRIDDIENAKPNNK